MSNIERVTKVVMNKTFLSKVAKECLDLRRVMTFVEQNRLDNTKNNFNAKYGHRCIYGLLFGDSLSERSRKVKNEITKPFSQYLSDYQKPKNTRFITQYGSGYTAVELFVEYVHDFYSELNLGYALCEFILSKDTKKSLIELLTSKLLA